MSKDLSPELKTKIDQEASRRFPLTNGNAFETGKRTGFIDGATEYAAKLHLLQQEYEAMENTFIRGNQSLQETNDKLKEENEALQRWKEEAKLLLNPIFEYAEKHPDMKIGGSMTEFVIDRCKEYDKLRAENERLHSSFDNLMAAHEKLQKEKLQNEVGVIETWRKKDAEYDKLKGENETLKQAADQNMGEYTKRLVEHAALKSEYDKLKGQIEDVIDLNESIASDYNKVCSLNRQLVAEHAAIKEKTEIFVTEVEKAHGTLIGGMPKDATKALNILQQALAKRRPTDWKCVKCGSFVDECNCGSNTNNQNEKDGH